MKVNISGIVPKNEWGTCVEKASQTKKLNKEEGKTFVLITHDPAVSQNTERLVQLRDGVIVGEKRLSVF